MLAFDPILNISIENSIPAGFPSPAEDHMEPSLSISDILIKHPQSTFYFRSGVDRKSIGISKDEILIVDRQVIPSKNDLVVLCRNGEFKIMVFDASSQSQPNPNELYQDNEIWGVITSIVKKIK